MQKWGLATEAPGNSLTWKLWQRQVLETIARSHVAAETAAFYLAELLHRAIY